MSLNSNHEQLVKLLTDLVYVVQHPEEFLNLVEESKKAVDEYKEVVEKQRKIHDIDSWYNEQYKVLESDWKEADEALAEAKEYKKSMEKLYSDKNKEVDKKLNDLADKEAKLDIELHKLTYLKSAIYAADQDRLELRKWKEELEDEWKILKEKQAAVNAVLNGAK